MMQQLILKVVFYAMKLTPYEIKRQETIRQNNLFLQSLNIIKQVPSQKRKKTLTLKSKPKVLQTRSSNRVSSNKTPKTEDPEPQPEKLLEFDQFFTEEVVAKAIKTNGKYNGGLNKITEEIHEVLKMTLKPKSWSKAKLAAFNVFETNPNQYFYR